MEEEFGDFQEVDETGKNVENVNVPVRVRLPRKGEVLGMINQRLGGNRMDVSCSDGKKRNCRVPGRFKRSMWLRPKDIVVIEPWKDDDEKGEIVFHYSSNAVNQLRRKGMLDFLQGGF